MSYPNDFSIDSFQYWYHQNIDDSIDLVRDIEKIRGDLAKKIIVLSKGESTWNMLQTFINSLKEYCLNSRDSATFDLIPNVLVNNADDFQRHYIKSTQSIINKMWRKNKELTGKHKQYYTVNNIKNKINDLIRFSVKTDSLKTAELFAQTLNNCKNIQQNSIITEFWRSYLKDISVDSELKMASGYFAYHCYFTLKGNIKIEFQIFSELSNYWRSLSHKIYEELRNTPKDQFKFNDVESRVVAVGHLLYLADCELNKIEEELKSK